MNGKEKTSETCKVQKKGPPIHSSTILPLHSSDGWPHLGQAACKDICLGIHRKSHHPVLRTPLCWEKKHLPKSHQIPNIPISMKSAIVCHKLPQNEPDKFLAKFPMARGLAPKVAFTSRSAEGIDSIPDVPPPASMDGLEIQWFQWSLFSKKTEILNHWFLWIRNILKYWKKNRITDNENVVLQIIVRCDHLVCRSEATRELNEVAPTSQRLTWLITVIPWHVPIRKHGSHGVNPVNVHFNQFWEVWCYFIYFGIIIPGINNYQQIVGLDSLQPLVKEIVSRELANPKHRKNHQTLLKPLDKLRTRKWSRGLSPDYQRFTFNRNHGNSEVFRMGQRKSV